MGRSGTDVGTVVRWDGAQHVGLVEFPDRPGTCWVEATALHPSTRGVLRAGQVVEVRWAATDSGPHPMHAELVTPRDDLQSTPGA